MNLMKRLMGGFFEAAGILLVAVIVVVVFAQVLARYVFHYPLPWGEEVVRFAFVYLIFVGAVVGMKNRAHLNIDFLLVALPPRARRLLNLLVNVLVAVFLGFVIVQGGKFVRMSGTQGTPYLQIPMSYAYAVIPFGALAMLYYLVRQTVELLKSGK